MTHESPKPYSVAAPEPGIYHNVSAEDYRSWRAWNQSALKARTPRDMIASMVGGDPSGALITGDRLHGAVLDRLTPPDAFDEQRVVRKYRSESSGRERTLTHDASAEYWAEARKAYGHDVWSPDQIELVAKMRAAIMANPVASELIGSLPMECREVSMVWRDPTTRLLCKARLDGFDPDRRLFIDLKTAQSVDPIEMGKAAVNHGYYLQAGMYVLGGMALCPAAGINPRSADYRIVAVSKEDKPQCVVYDMPDDGVTYASDGSQGVWISRGVQEMRHRMSVVARCVAEAVRLREEGSDPSAAWPGYPITARLEPPRWWHEQWSGGLDVMA